jgi:hypothetical protein
MNGYIVHAPKSVHFVMKYNANSHVCRPGYILDTFTEIRINVNSCKVKIIILKKVLH